jgi:hypothetical protein
MSAIGAYPYETPLWEALVENLHVLTDNGITASILIEALMNIQSAYEKGENTFICRERYRAWSKLVDDLTGLSTPLWEEITREEEWPMEIAMAIEDRASSIWEIFFCDEFDITSLLDLLDASNDEEDVLAAAAEVVKPTNTLVMCSPQLGVIYVLNSPEVRGCGVLSWEGYQGVHLFEDVADASSNGDIDTYVLPNHILEYAESIVEDGKRHAS